jgi:hypothetical protein
MPITLENLSVLSSANLIFSPAGLETARLTTNGFEMFGKDISAGNFNGGPLGGFRNKIINGRMDISQRGSTFTNPASGTLTLDRWMPTHQGISSSFTVSWVSDAPAGTDLVNSLRVTATTADTSVGRTDSFMIRQRIEGFNAQDFFSNWMRLTFWFKATQTGSYSFCLFNGAHDQTFVGYFFVSASNTWQQFSYWVPNIPAAGSWDKTTGIGLQLGFTLVCGTTFQTFTYGWQAGTFAALTGQVNAFASAGNIVGITGVQLELGKSVFGEENVSFNPFEQRDYGTELTLCQRYYQEIGTAGDNILVYQNTNVYPSASYVTYYFTTSYATSMRPTPTASLITSGGSWGSSNGLTLTVTPSINTIRYNMTVGANPSSSIFYFQNWNPSNRIVLESEL